VRRAGLTITPGFTSILARASLKTSSFFGSKAVCGTFADCVKARVLAENEIAQG
jgi:hypothetical protein